MAKILYDEQLHSTDMAPKKYRQKVKQQKQSQATPHEHPHHHKKGKDRRSLYLSIAAVLIVVIVVGAIAASGLTGNGGSTNPTASPSPTSGPTADSSYVNSTYVFFHTSMGNFTVQLRNDMPITTTNFLNLVRQGAYDGSTFHRIIEGFMIQGGILANGTTVPSIQDERTSTNHNYYMTIAMAKTSLPNSATSQFFINTVDNSGNILPDGSKFDDTYSAFGKVIYGDDVVMAISRVATNANDVPLQPVNIISATILNA